MSFNQIIKEDRIPLTKDKLMEDLMNLGIREDDFIIVHTSLNKIGYVIGKEQTLISALVDVVGDNGLIVMPTQTSDNSNPKTWCNPPVPNSWIEPLKKHMLAFDKNLTPTRGLGVVPEFFRKMSNVYRSNHPQVSFAAYGKKKEELLHNHPLEYSLNDNSPLGKMYQWKFKIVMLGTDYETCTAMHLSEYRAKCSEEIIQECAMMVNNERKWVHYLDIDLNSDNFNEIGLLYEKSHEITFGKVGYAKSYLIDMVSLIDFSTKYLSK